MGCASSKTSCVSPDAPTGASMPRHHHRNDRCNAGEEQRSAAAAAAAAWSAATSADPDERPATAMRNGITTDVAVGDWCPVPLAQLPYCSGETTCDFAHASETPCDDPCSTTLDDDDNAAWLANATAAVGCAVPPLPLESPSAASCLVNPLAPPTQVPSDTQSSVETVIAFTVHSVHAADDTASLDPVAMVVGVAEADEERTSSVVVLETWSATCDLDASRPPASPASPPRGVALRVPRTPTSRASAPPLSSRGLLWQ